MSKIPENPRLREKFQVIMKLAESLEGNPEAMEKLNGLLKTL